mgnify:CR=1 FL=1
MHLNFIFLKNGRESIKSEVCYKHQRSSTFSSASFYKDFIRTNEAKLLAGGATCPLSPALRFWPPLSKISMQEQFVAFYSPDAKRFAKSVVHGSLTKLNKPRTYHTPRNKQNQYSINDNNKKSCFLGKKQE